MTPLDALLREAFDAGFDASESGGVPDQPEFRDAAFDAWRDRRLPLVEPPD